jgi:hypothetical protein
MLQPSKFESPVFTASCKGTEAGVASQVRWKSEADVGS